MMVPLVIHAMAALPMVVHPLVAHAVSGLQPQGRRTNPRLGPPGEAFATDWYAAREAGERRRGEAMAFLYRNVQRGAPGGRRPDPRGGSAYGLWTMLQATAYLMGIELQPLAAPGHDSRRWCWLIIYPAQEAMTITHRPVPADPAQYARFLFQLGELLGDIDRRWQYLTDPTHPGGYYEPADDRGTTALLHQFANAYLGWGPSCPPQWGCDCNGIRAGLNAAPTEHAQPTDQLAQDAIRQQMARREKIKPMVARQPDAWTLPPAQEG
jgi:hypothetical protein